MAFWNKKKEKKVENVKPGTSLVKNIVAIGSGKGGVGKSTVSTELAVSLASRGYKVGLMDADIYGPSQPAMLGASDEDRKNLKTVGNALVPIEKHGVSFMSMGLLGKKDMPVIWRAPMAQKIIQQFLGGIMWGELDFLLIDLPPGTGDVQITLAQQANLTGAVIVSTPQNMALKIAEKGLKMFNEVNVPIIGLVENMSGFVCPHCDKETEIFKKGGGEGMSDGLNVPFLGAVPLDPQIMGSLDDGNPLENIKKNSPTYQSIENVTKNFLESLEKTVKESNKLTPENVSLGEGDSLEIEWKDGASGKWKATTLRYYCPCASCVDEDTGVRKIKMDDISLDIKILSAKPVGRYGINLQFSDQHKTGIYRFDLLKDFKEKSGTDDSFDV